MCTVYKDYGSPKIDNPSVRKAARLIAYLYSDWGENEPTGGLLHVQLDDWNIGGGGWFIEPFSRLRRLRPPNKTELAIASIMNTMTEIEQASALGLADGYWSIPGFEVDISISVTLDELLQ